MNNILRQLEKLQEKLKQAEYKRHKLEGQLEAIKKEMKEMGFNDLLSLKKEKEKLEQEATKKELILDNEIQKFKNEFGELLNKIEEF